VDEPDEDEGGRESPLPKPDELLALHGVTEELFGTLRDWFSVPDVVPLDLSDIDAAVRQLADPVMIAALAMRKLQALRLLSTPGVVTTTDVVVTIVQDLDRALIQAPVMRLRVRADTTDWDAELAALDDVEPYAPDAPGRSDDDDPETERFVHLHGRLHDAVRAVLTVSEGRIRELM
jgi:hypothetical protein